MINSSPHLSPYHYLSLGTSLDISTVTAPMPTGWTPRLSLTLAGQGKGLSSVLTQPLTLGVLSEISPSLNSLFRSKPVITLLAVLCKNCATFSLPALEFFVGLDFTGGSETMNVRTLGMVGRGGGRCVEGVLDLRAIGCINKAGLGEN